MRYLKHGFRAYLKTNQFKLTGKLSKLRIQLTKDPTRSSCLKQWYFLGLIPQLSLYRWVCCCMVLATCQRLLLCKLEAVGLGKVAYFLPSLSQQIRQAELDKQTTFQQKQTEHTAWNFGRIGHKHLPASAAACASCRYACRELSLAGCA